MKAIVPSEAEPGVSSAETKVLFSVEDCKYASEGGPGSEEPLSVRARRR
jgi:hypothetical protein